MTTGSSSIRSILVAASLSALAFAGQPAVAAPVTEAGKTEEGFEFIPGTVIPLNEPDRLRLNAARAIFARQFLDLRARIEDDEALESALSHLERGEFEEALEESAAYIQNDAGVAEAHEIRGVALTYLGQSEDGIKALEEAARLAPDLSAPLTKIGDIYVAMNKMDDARAAYKRAVQTEPANKRAQSRYGIALEAAQLYSEAIPHLVKSLEGADPSKISPAKIALARALILTDSASMAVKLLEPVVEDRSPGSPIAVILGNAYLAAGDYNKAIRVLSAAHESNETDPGVAYALGRAYAFLGRNEEALGVFAIAAANAQEPSIVNREIAAVHLAAGELDRAETLFRRLATSEQARGSDFRLIGDIQVARGDLEDAEKTYADMVEKFPEDPVAYHKLGSLRAAMTHYEAAADTLEAGLERIGPQADILRTLVMVRMRLGDLAGARRAADQLVEVSNDSAGAHTLAGSVYEQSGETEKAAAFYQKAIAIDPDNVVALNNLASLLSGRGAFDDAVEYASRARMLDKENAIVAHNLGWISFNLDRLDDAKTLLEEAESKDGDNARLIYRLGRVYEAVGDPVIARAKYDKALSLSESFEGANDARARLAALAPE